MRVIFVFILFFLGTAAPAFTQTAGSVFKLALPTHPGSLTWRADGYKMVESSAKANTHEIGVRARNADGRVTFLGFLFIVGEEPNLTSAKCRDGALKVDKKGNHTLRVTGNSEILLPANPPIELVAYSVKDRAGKSWYNLRGFVATEDLCGDLDFYSNSPIGREDPELKNVFNSFRLDSAYVPRFRDIFVYAQILYTHHAYGAAAPIFESALSKVGEADNQEMWRRITTDQAGMAYGISGRIKKARSLFEAAIAKDPDYPLNYYNLACADAEEGKLKDARIHLQQAFDRKANVIKGEMMPDPTKDDSFLPYRKNRDFWKFVESLH